MPPEPPTYVSRAGEKLHAALESFVVSPAGKVCADFGCNVGGFTDCLLRAGAAKVFAVDTGYGQLAWRLRTDSRVVVMERTNALHCPVPQPVDLVAVDTGWTTQERVVPAALRWLGPAGCILSLLKPHYELACRLGHPPGEVLTAAQSRGIVAEVCPRLGRLGAVVRAVFLSPLRGKGGNEEYFLLIGPG